MNCIGFTSCPPLPKVNWLPPDVNTVLTPLLPVALLGVLVRMKSPKLKGANPVEAVEVELPLEVPPDEVVPDVPPVDDVCANATVAMVKSPQRP